MSCAAWLRGVSATHESQAPRILRMPASYPKPVCTDDCPSIVISYCEHTGRYTLPSGVVDG